MAKRDTTGSLDITFTARLGRVRDGDTWQRVPAELPDSAAILAPAASSKWPGPLTAFVRGSLHWPSATVRTSSRWRPRIRKTTGKVDGDDVVVDLTQRLQRRPRSSAASRTSRTRSPFRPLGRIDDHRRRIPPAATRRMIAPSRRPSTPCSCTQSHELGGTRSGRHRAGNDPAATSGRGGPSIRSIDPGARNRRRCPNRARPPAAGSAAPRHPAGSTAQQAGYAMIGADRLGQDVFVGPWFAGRVAAVARATSSPARQATSSPPAAGRDAPAPRAWGRAPPEQSRDLVTPRGRLRRLLPPDPRSRQPTVPRWCDPSREAVPRNAASASDDVMPSAGMIAAP